jgi:hypothetical protein
MTARGLIEGEMRQYDKPDWGPLEDLLCSDALCAHFMWMGDIELEDGTIVNEYKHRWTRQYLHLADDGRSFNYAGQEHYREVDVILAIGAVFMDWECCDPRPEERVALRSVLRNLLSVAD